MRDGVSYGEFKRRVGTRLAFFFFMIIYGLRKTIEHLTPLGLPDFQCCLYLMPRRDSDMLKKHMKTIIAASKNPVKMAAVREGFERMFSGETFAVEGVVATSGVSDQPQSDTETRQGALQRTALAAAVAPAADFHVGIEGGIEQKEDGMEAFAWVVIRGPNGKIGTARSASFFLPPRVAALIKEGKELGEADDIVFGRVNSKQENGAVGLLTDDAIDRKTYYREAVIMALIPFKNPTLYS